MFNNLTPFKSDFRPSRGFTMIELMVSIAIIAVISTIGISTMNHALQKARDTKRMDDLKLISAAAELYYEDHKAYPTIRSDSQMWAWPRIFDDPDTPEFDPERYISHMPNDPMVGQVGTSGASTGMTFHYVYDHDPSIGLGRSDPQHYVLCTTLELPPDDVIYSPLACGENSHNYTYFQIR